MPTNACCTLYFGQVTKASWARLQLMKMMSEFREGMWAVVQQAISTLDTDFVSYANERLGNCERIGRQAGVRALARRRRRSRSADLKRSLNRPRARCP